jgi:hypothetical protein
MKDSRYIDFISAYCDRWCERCAFTERCSLFAVEAAMAMCDGDGEEAMELAVGRAPSEDGEEEDRELSAWIDEVHASSSLTPAEAEAFGRAKAERDARLDATSIMQTARAYTVLAARWLRATSAALKKEARCIPGADERRRPALRGSLEPAQLLDALEVVEWDCILITVKLRRALNGLDEIARGDLDGDFVRDDANGTAKLALLCVDRSESAWRTIAGWSDNEFAAIFAEQLAQLRGEVEETFPRAREFVRPGLDEGGTEV